MDPLAPLPPEVVLPVSYSGRGASNRELKGRGTFRYHGSPALVEFTGEPHAQGPATLTFPRAAIYNVTISGRRLDFLVDPVAPGDEVRTFVVYFEDEASATTVAQLLPERVDSELAAHLEFQDRFEALGQGRHPQATVTNALIAINVAVFVVMCAVFRAGWFNVTDLTPYYLYGANNGAATTGGEWWRLVTAMFLHYGVLHLALNMWALHQAGNLLERLQGRTLYTITYFACGFGGGVLSLFWHGDKVWSAGASGAIFGLYGALLGYMLREKQSLPRTVYEPLIRSTLTFAGYNLFYGFVSPGIDNGAHIGGLVTGFVLGWLTALPIDPERRAAGLRPRLQIALALLVAIPASAYFLAPRYDYNFREELAWRQLMGSEQDREKNVLVHENEARRLTMQNPSHLGAWIDVIDREVIPYYKGIIQKLDAVQFTPKLATARRRDVLNQFAHLRLDAYQHLARGLKTNTPSDFTDFQRLNQQSEAILKNLK